MPSYVPGNAGADVLMELADAIATALDAAAQKPNQDRFWYLLLGRRLFPRPRPLPRHPTLPRPALPDTLPRSAQPDTLPRSANG